MNKNCPICREKMSYFTSSQNLEILKCSNCGLGMTDKLPAQSSDYHRDDQYLKEEKLFRNIFTKRVNIIDELHAKGKVLEIGCSTGLLLSILKSKGWDVTGVELSLKAAKKAEERGVRVLVGDFSKLIIKDKFNVVILNHTLEHFGDPVSVLKKAGSLLEKEGLLYVDLPNFDSLSAKILKSSWPSLLPREHLWHFTLSSLQILLKGLGFKIIYTEMASGIWDYGRPIYGVFLSLMLLKKRFFNEVVTALPSLITSKLRMGSDLMVVAKKV